MHVDDLLRLSNGQALRIGLCVATLGARCRAFLRPGACWLAPVCSVSRARHFEPITTPARNIGAIAALGNNSIKLRSASLSKELWPFARHVIAVAQRPAWHKVR